jgi:hypothetical protein
VIFLHFASYACDWEIGITLSSFMVGEAPSWGHFQKVSPRSLLGPLSVCFLTNWGKISPAGWEAQRPQQEFLAPIRQTLLLNEV